MSERRLVGVLGLARSGRAAARLGLARGDMIYASDSGDTPELRAAADEIHAAGGAAQVGGHSIEDLGVCDVIVVSPGIPPAAEILNAEALLDIPHISELEYAWTFLRSQVIAVTGTNGKSTTTALTSHLLETAGLSAPAAGNIGLPLSAVALESEPPDWVVAEASSFQLAGVRTFAPRIGIVTNLSPDHLDRYPTVDAYYRDKARLFRNASDASTWVLNAADEAVMALAGSAPGQRRYFRVDGPLAEDRLGAYRNERGALVLRGTGGDLPLVNVAELNVLGAHNHANALAAAVAAIAAGADAEAVAAGLRTFGGLEHRLEVVTETGGVQWINDSKATNIDSTIVAARSMTRPTVLLLGGRHKGEPYARLIPELKPHVVLVLAYGEAADLIVQDLAGHVPVERIDGNFKDVVDRAFAAAPAGGAVLLSPACASFDMFHDYEDRGRRFKELALSRRGGALG